MQRRLNSNARAGKQWMRFSADSNTDKTRFVSEAAVHDVK
jgi:hypothetical protein